MELRGAKVLLTGASGGLGHAIARILHGRGASLVLTGRRTGVLEPLAAELGAAVVACDLSDRDAVAALAEGQRDADVLIANAGLPGSGPLIEYSDEQIDRAIDVNLRAPAILARTIAPEMVARGRGHIVFVSSLSGLTGQAGSAVYSATKFGLRGLGQGLRGDLAGSGVGVTTVFPGFIRDAGMFHETGAELPRGVGTSTPGQVAEAVLRGIVRDKAEIVVAPAMMRIGSRLGGLAPDLALRVARISGGDRVSADVARGQAHLR
ncbi:MAG: SDR family NAD(P)-dependent oxidoreductase [Baekduia sp.]